MALPLDIEKAVLWQVKCHTHNNKVINKSAVHRFQDQSFTTLTSAYTYLNSTEGIHLILLQFRSLLCSQRSLIFVIDKWTWLHLTGKALSGKSVIMVLDKNLMDSLWGEGIIRMWTKCSNDDSLHFLSGKITTSYHYAEWHYLIKNRFKDLEWRKIFLCYHSWKDLLPSVPSLVVFHGENKSIVWK